MALDVQVVTKMNEFQGLREDWDRLLTRCPARSPFVSFEWAVSWLKIFGDEVKLKVITVWSDGNLRAIAPLCERAGRVLTFIGYPQNDYADVVCEAGDFESIDLIVRTLPELGRWRRVVLDQIPAKSQFELLSEALSRIGRPFRVEMSDPCPAMILDDIEQARKLYDKRNTRTYMNWYRKRGELAYVVFEERDVAVTHLEDLFEQHTARWHGTATPSYFLDAKMRAFYREFVWGMYERGWAKVTALRLDGENLAMYMVFEFDGKMYLYKTCYDPKYAKRSPGQVILRFLFEYALMRNVRELDFGRGDEGYKERFANIVRQNRRIIIYRGRVGRTADAVIGAIRGSWFVDVMLRNSLARRVKNTVLKVYRGRRRLPAEHSELEIDAGSIRTDIDPS